MRAAIYARFFSDLQDARSINDQVALARKYADARGFKVVSLCEDAAISGASILNRPGLQKLLAEAVAKTIDVVVPKAWIGYRAVKQISRRCMSGSTFWAFASRLWRMAK